MRMDIMTELDLKFVMDRFEVPTFYVTVSRILSENPRHVAAPQPSFVNLLISQTAFQYAHTFKNQASSESRCDLSFSGDMDRVETEVNEDNEYGSPDDGGELNEVGQPVRDDFPIENRLVLLDGRTSKKQWVIPGALYQASLPVNDSPDCARSKRDALSVGGIFSNKDSMKIAIGLYHLSNRVEY